MSSEREGETMTDAKVMEGYRRVLEDAAEELEDRRLIALARKTTGATAALFDALARRDERERAMLAVVRAVASGEIFLCPTAGWALAFENGTLGFAQDILQKARSLVGE